MVEKFPQWANIYDKVDIERLGLFTEMPYMNGKGYVSLFPKPVTTKGRNIMGEGSKGKNGTQAGYFDKEFRRLFVGEAIKGRGRKQKPSKFKPVSKLPFMPPAGPKKNSTPGDYYGSFSGNIAAMSNRRRKVPPYQKPPKNFITSPAKKGGPGYTGICLNKYPLHAVDRYGEKKKYKQYGINLSGPMQTIHYPRPYFLKNPYPDPPSMKPGPTYVKPKTVEKEPLEPGYIIPPGINKLPGFEYFDTFPEYKPNKYVTIYDLVKPRKYEGQVFLPHSTSTKSFYTASIIAHNIPFRVNSNNYGPYEPSYIKHLVDGHY